MKDLKRILLVEDDPKDAELTLVALAEHNMANEAALARDGVEAQINQPPPDFAIGKGDAR